jgi:hypothetical protein
MKERINEGSPPSSREFHEFEARQSDQPGPTGRLRMITGKGRPKPLQLMTLEQIFANAERMEKALRMCVDALDLEEWDGRWGNRLMQAHTYGRTTLEEAATWTKPEEVDEQGTLLPVDADGSSVSSRPAGGGE